MTSSYPKLKVISFILCPYVQRVIVTLNEKGIPFEKEFIDISNKPDWFLKLSPNGKVPILVVDEKQVLYESTAIIEYLEDLAPQKPLHPKDIVLRALNRALFDFISGIYAGLSALVAADEKTFPDKVKELKEKFDKLEKKFHGPYFNGSDFSFVDVLLASAFRQLDQWEDQFETGILADAPKLKEYRKRILSRPSVKEAVLPEFHEAYLESIKKKNGFLAKKLNLV